MPTVSRLVFTVPVHATNLLRIRKRAYTPIAQLNAEIIKSPEPIPFAELNTEEFTPFKMDKKWGSRYDCAWFKFTGTIPENTEGDVVAIVNIDGEGVVYTEDGEILQGITIVQGNGDKYQPLPGKQVVELDKLRNGNEVRFLVDAGNNKISRNRDDDVAYLKRCVLAVVNHEVNAFFYDYATLYLLTISLDKGDSDYGKFLKILTTSYSTAAKGDWSEQSVKAARSSIAAVMNEVSVAQPLNITAIGHAHLDLAWLWPIRETKRKAVRTLSNAFVNIDKHPNFIMGISQPQQVKWMKDEYPTIFEKFKKYVADGRIEPQGAMWVESDCNLVSGESLVRQYKYGKKFWKEEFDKDVTVTWLPDAFGFSAQLPQIMQKCGVDSFFTIKLTWNTVNEFPYHSFFWEGIDGTKVLAHMAPQGDYNSSASPLAIAKTASKYKEAAIAPEALLCYGPGDGGGGPGEFCHESLERVSALERYHNVRTGSSRTFFDRLSACAEALPTYHGELYLEKHRGVYTSQAKNKAYNRRIEYAQHNVEALSVAVPDFALDQERLDAIWQEMLLYQFHDILPGSSIGRVYNETNKAYEAMLDELREMEKQMLSASECNGLPTVANLTSFARKEWLKYADKWYDVSVAPYATAPLILEEEPEYGFLFGDEKTLENNRVKLSFDALGTITSMIFKDTGTEYSDGFMNKLLMYEDKEMHYNAWDINPDYIYYPKNDIVLRSIKVLRDGPQIIRQHVYTFNKSSIIQNVVLTAGSEEVRFDTRVYWDETHIMLRAEFMPKIYSHAIACDIQFGNLRRRTTKNNSIEEAQFEICAHKYVNMDGEKEGIAILNDSKYGLRAKNNIVSLNLLRSPVYPDKNCDRCEHNFSYSIFPHRGKLDNSDVMAKATALNNPLLVSEVGATFESLVESSNKTVVIDGIKRADTLKGVTLRVFNNTDGAQETVIKTSIKFKQAFECDLLEQKPTRVALSKPITFKPFEIKTFILK